MTWGEFKRQVARGGVRDHDVIAEIDYRPDATGTVTVLRDSATTHVRVVETGLTCPPAVKPQAAPLEFTHVLGCEAGVARESRLVFAGEEGPVTAERDPGERQTISDHIRKAVSDCLGATRLPDDGLVNDPALPPAATVRIAGKDYPVIFSYPDGVPWQRARDAVNGDVPGVEFVGGDGGPLEREPSHLHYIPPADGPGSVVPSRMKAGRAAAGLPQPPFTGLAIQAETYRVMEASGLYGPADMELARLRVVVPRRAKGG